MKRTLILALATCLIYSGCKKEDNNENPTVKLPDPNAMKYSISGLADITLEQNDDSVTAIAIGHTGGKQEKLTLSAIDLPANFSVTFETPSGIPSFGSIVRYKTTGATPGTHSFKIKAVTASDSVKLFNLNLTVKTPPPPPPPDSGCASKLLGNYSNAYTGGGSGTVATTVHWVSKEQLKFTNLPGFPADVTTSELNCSMQTFKLSQASASGKTITYAYGSFNNNVITLQYGVSDGSGVESYNCTMTK